MWSLEHDPLGLTTCEKSSEMKVISLLALLLVTTPHSALSSGDLETVIRVIDGDTIAIREDKIRLYGIDCPESGEPYAEAAAKKMAELVAGEKVRIERRSRDWFKRIVARVFVEGQDVGEVMLKNGLARVYPKYCKDPICEEWKQYEETARAKGLGVWQTASEN